MFIYLEHYSTGAKNNQTQGLKIVLLFKKENSKFLTLKARDAPNIHKQFMFTSLLICTTDKGIHSLLHDLSLPVLICCLLLKLQ